MIVRAAQADDVEPICRICTEGWRDTYPGLRSPEEIEAAVAEFYAPDRIRGEIAPAGPAWGGWWVAEVQAGEPVAAGAGGITAPGIAELFVLYADPAHRYHGAGSAVLAAITQQQVSQGAREQWASVVPGNTKGIPFYEARGFVLAGERASHHSSGTTLRYRRVLTL